MMCLSLQPLEELRNMPSDNKVGMIVRTLFRLRGYKCKAYATEFDGRVFCLIHYNRKILEVDVIKSKIVSYDGWSFSDGIAIELALSILKLGKKYHVTRYCGIPPTGLVVWHNDTPLKSNGEPMGLEDLEEYWIDWLKRRRYKTILRWASKYSFGRWYYRILYGKLPFNKKLFSEECTIPEPLSRRIRRESHIVYEQKRLDEWIEHNQTSVQNSKLGWR